MKGLMIGVSGVRGIIGEGLNPEVVVRLGQAFGTYLEKGKVIVGMDTRTSGPMIKAAMVSGLLSTGCKVIDLGISTTPTLQIMVEELKADGGVVITGSHNPSEWNALKFVKSNGVFLNAEEGKELLNIYWQGSFNSAKWDEIHEVENITDAKKFHISKILNILDIDLIKKKKFRVCIDCCNGAGSVITPEFLEELGCDVVKIHCTPNGYFPHNPEPTFVNLSDLAEKTLSAGCDIGFAQDADADRCAIITEKGEILSEEYSIAIVADYILKKSKGDVVVNLSTTRMIDIVAQKYGVKVIRTPVGEVNVAEKMKEVQAVIGGEGNGGIIDPRVHYGRDSFIGIGLVLEYLAKENKKVSDIVSNFPKYYIDKRKVELPRKKMNSLIKYYCKKYSDLKINLDDGIRIDADDFWFHLRMSGTEPVLRVIVESVSKQKTEELINNILVELEKIKT